MCFVEVTVMDQKQEFILKWLAGDTSFSQLCRESKVTRTTGYRYVEKFKKDGMAGLENRSTRPLSSPQKTPKAIEDRIIKLRTTGQTKGEGAKKILWYLQQEGIYNNLPSRSTVSKILKRNGLIPERKKRKRVEPRNPIFDPAEPNEVWSADFKGQFKLNNGETCYPLTICDSKSRMILATKGLHSTNYKDTRKIYERVFKEYGLPKQLHTDNGPPFGCIKALGRLTQLGAWLMELGVEPVFSDPGKPQQNGRHERMHRDLKKAVCQKPSKNFQAQQVKFNKYIHHYNYSRPHESLGMRPPAQVHTKSERVYTGKIKEWVYPENYTVKYICHNGIIRIGTKGKIFIGTALGGKKVGLEPLDNGIFRLYFRDFLLGYVDWEGRKAYDINDRQY